MSRLSSDINLYGFDLLLQSFKIRAKYKNVYPLSPLWPSDTWSSKIKKEGAKRKKSDECVNTPFQVSKKLIFVLCIDHIYEWISL